MEQWATVTRIYQATLDRAARERTGTCNNIDGPIACPSCQCTNYP
jgi:hypothetical protein